MTDDPTTNWDRRRDGAVGAVLGATLGPLGAAIGGATDGTRLALRLSVGADAAGDDAADAPAINEDATTIRMADAATDDADADGARRKGKRVPVAERLGSRECYVHT